MEKYYQGNYLITWSYQVSLSNNSIIIVNVINFLNN